MKTKPEQQPAGQQVCEWTLVQIASGERPDFNIARTALAQWKEKNK